MNSGRDTGDFRDVDHVLLINVGVNKKIFFFILLLFFSTYVVYIYMLSCKKKIFFKMHMPLDV